MREANGLTQADLAPLFGSPSIVSEVLLGKRFLALSHIQKLAAHVGVLAKVFLTLFMRSRWLLCKSHHCSLLDIR